MSIKVKRRTILKAAGVSAGIAATGYGLSNFENEQAVATVPTLVAPISPAERSRAWHVLNRITFGPRPGMVEKLTQMGLTAFIKQQLNYATINDDAANQLLASYKTLNMSVSQLSNDPDGKEVPNIDQELVEATIVRGIYSKRQLYEVMVLFWSEHFSIMQGKGWCYMLKTVDDREVVRKHALGKFRDLLHASAQSPAMLEYLDNASSAKEHPNENYAREIMELHTLGVGNYTEQDIKELARCLTGWSIEYDRTKPMHGQFLYRDYAHDEGAKTVLGHHIPSGGGMQDALTVIDILANHPLTAKRICTKLCRRFINDTPSDRIIQKTIDTFLKTGGDISSILMTIFTSEEFWYADPKYKRPHEYLLSLFRTFNIVPSKSWWDAAHDLEVLGHRPFAHPTPDGYSDISTQWIGGSMMDRWNLGINYTWKKGQSGLSEDLFQLAQKNGAKATAEDVVNYYAQLMLGRPLSKTENDILWKQVKATGSPDLKTGRESIVEAIILLATSPAFQYR